MCISWTTHAAPSSASVDDGDDEGDDGGGSGDGEEAASLLVDVGDDPFGDTALVVAPTLAILEGAASVIISLSRYLEEGRKRMMKRREEETARRRRDGPAKQCSRWGRCKGGWRRSRPGGRGRGLGESHRGN